MLRLSAASFKCWHEDYGSPFTFSILIKISGNGYSFQESLFLAINKKLPNMTAASRYLLSLGYPWKIRDDVTPHELRDNRLLSHLWRDLNAASQSSVAAIRDLVARSGCDSGEWQKLLACNRGCEENSPMGHLMPWYDISNSTNLVIGIDSHYTESPYDNRRQNLVLRTTPVPMKFHHGSVRQFFCIFSFLKIFKVVHHCQYRHCRSPRSCDRSPASCQPPLIIFFSSFLNPCPIFMDSVWIREH